MAFLMGWEGKGAEEEEKAAIVWWDNEGKEKLPRSGLPSGRQRGTGT